MGRWASFLLVIVVLGIALRACVFPSRDEPGELRAQEAPAPAQQARSSEPIALFDGHSLDNWERIGEARFAIENEGIVGETVSGHASAFLATRAEYADFRLELDLRARSPGDSGVRVRSEIARTQTGATPALRGRAVEVGGGIRADQWQHLSILCQGARCLVEVDGVTTSDSFESTRLAGRIALELSAGPQRGIVWRNLRLTPLSASRWRVQEPVREHAIGRDASLRLTRKGTQGSLRLRSGGEGAQPRQSLDGLSWDAEGIDVLFAQTPWSAWHELELHLCGSRLVLIADGTQVLDQTLSDCPMGAWLRCDPELAQVELLVSGPVDSALTPPTR